MNRRCLHCNAMVETPLDSVFSYSEWGISHNNHSDGGEFKTRVIIKDTRFRFYHRLYLILSRAMYRAMFTFKNWVR